MDKLFAAAVEILWRKYGWYLVALKFVGGNDNFG